MGLAPGGGCRAPRMYAADIAGYDGTSDSGGDAAGGPADIERFTLRTEHHGDNGRVAGDPAGGLGGDWRAGAEGPGAGALDGLGLLTAQVVQPDRHRYLGLLAA